VSLPVPMIEQVEKTILDELEKIGRDDRAWYSKPCTVRSIVSDDFAALPRPLLFLLISASKEEPQMGQKYRTTAVVEVHCNTVPTAARSASTELHRLMRDVKKALAEACRPDNGVLDTGYLFVTESSVTFDLNTALTNAVGVVSTEIQWEWSADAP